MTGLRSLQAQPLDNSKIVVLIKYFSGRSPVIEVRFNGIATFDMAFDPSASGSAITQAMARQLNVMPLGDRPCQVADGRTVDLPFTHIRSVAVGAAMVTDMYMCIVPDTAESRLGQDFFSGYDVRISKTNVTLYRQLDS